MNKIILVAILFSCINMHAQDTDIKKEKLSNNYLGVQANYLIKEIVNFGGNNNASNLNPYAFIFHRNNIKSGWGVRLGLGPNIYSIANNNGSAKNTTKGYNLSGRLGLDKRYVISPKWETGYGLDAIFLFSDDKTVNDNINFQGFKTDITTGEVGYGGGIMGYLRYAIHPKIWLGTESSFYALNKEIKSKIVLTDQFGVPTETNDTDKTLNGQFALPVTLYLILKL